ncbi:hypothetical protein [Lactococcus lactis]|uniref:Uncharacterized protein n=1 Tax=Lactococcus lactis TaxID=1358 RepID=A0AAW5TS58_9LACT|nr:hypothetical protein [Lactococcus lactis]MCW2282202.1 hypothetical protein [Lactococcus lactis]
MFELGYKPPKNEVPESTFKVPKDKTLGSGLVPEDKYYIEQIEGYKEQIKVLTRLLENQQILTKQVQDNAQTLLLENTEVKKELAEEKSKGFWKRLFGK